MHKSVQSAVTSVSFPRTLDDLRKMGRKWLGLVGQDWITDLDILLHFPSGHTVPWIAPKWLTAGDLLFFYHTKSARGLISTVTMEALAMRREAQTRATPHSEEEIETLITILDRVDRLSQGWTGRIFAVGEVSGRPERAFDANKHFKGTIYAPLSSVVVFEKPVSSDEFKRFLKIGQNTITPVYGSQFSELKQLLAKGNAVPTFLQDAVPGDLSFRDVTRHNWADVSCRGEARFINEAQLRAYLLDYLLHAIKDPRSPVHAECYCYRNNARTGIVDYFIRLNGDWVPVEAKLNLLAEEDLHSQLAKYIHLNSFRPTIGSSTGDCYPVDDGSWCVVCDQAGMYVTCNGSFMNCSVDRPVIRREDIRKLGTARVRDKLLEAMR